MMGQIRASQYDICKYLQERLRLKCEAYGSGGSYAILAGKDGSRSDSWTVSMSSLGTEDVVAGCSMLKEKVCRTFDDWHPFFLYLHLPLSHSQLIYHRKRHDIVYLVVDFAAASN
jgi:hypothetical protein